MADEWQRSAYLTNALERSDFSNKLWLADEENGNPLAAWIKWKQGIHTFDTAVFSGTYDDYVGVERQQTYYASWLGDFSDGSAFDLKDFWLSFYSQDSTTSEDRLGKGNDYALLSSIASLLALGPSIPRSGSETTVLFRATRTSREISEALSLCPCIGFRKIASNWSRATAVRRFRQPCKRHPAEQPSQRLAETRGFERGPQQWSGRRSSQLVRRIELLFLRRKPEVDFRYSAR